MESGPAFIPAGRLRAQGLSDRLHASPPDAVRALGAVQAQDYAGAAWALGLRTGAARSDVDRLFDEGALLRTHVLRPTWHFVLPEDVRWLQELTGRRIVRGLAGRYRRLELDEDQAARGLDAVCRALAGGRHLTRAELGAVVEDAGVSAAGQRLPHLLMRAEHEALIVSGPRRGKQFTWALLEERAPQALKLDPEQARAELVLRYFRSHGPAQVQDFVWWSGLTAADARAGLAAAGPALASREVDGRSFWFDPSIDGTMPDRTVAHLLPNFDEYTVGYRDRSDLVDPARPLDLSRFAFGSILGNVLAVDGRVRGTWRLTRAGVEVDPAQPLHPLEREAVDTEVARLDRFRAG